MYYSAGFQLYDELVEFEGKKGLLKNSSEFQYKLHVNITAKVAQETREYPGIGNHHGYENYILQEEGEIRCLRHVC